MREKREEWLCQKQIPDLLAVERKEWMTSERCIKETKKEKAWKWIRWQNKRGQTKCLLTLLPKSSIGMKWVWEKKRNDQRDNAFPLYREEEARREKKERVEKQSRKVTGSERGWTKEERDKKERERERTRRQVRMGNNPNDGGREEEM